MSSRLCAALSLTVSVFVSVMMTACSMHQTPAETFRLRSECANQARAFEQDWRKDNPADFAVLIFQNHYNQGTGGCYVYVFHVEHGQTFEDLYDALEGVGRRPLVSTVDGKDDSPELRKIHTLLERAINE
jgi:hypothetical protein